MLTALLSIIGEMHCSCVSDDLTITTQFLDAQGQAHLDDLLLECSGGYREGETPGPIPNPEAKTLFAHNTASFRCGNVGRRQASRLYSPLLNQSTYLFLNTTKCLDFLIGIRFHILLSYHNSVTYLLQNDTFL